MICTFIWTSRIPVLIVFDMEEKEAFYNKLYEQAAGGSSNWDLSALLGLQAVRAWGEAHKGQRARCLDVGCGRGDLSRDLSLLLKQRCAVDVESHGVDLVEPADHCYGQAPGGLTFHRQSFDGKKLDYQDSAFDLVLCNHVIEHIFETEFLLDELCRVLKADGLCVLSTPNLACWVNRVLLLLGIQPLSTEVGTRSMVYGWPVFRGKISGWTPPGHIRSFTAGALRDMSEACGFRVVGTWRQERKLLYRNIALVLTKRGESSSARV